MELVTGQDYYLYFQKAPHRYQGQFVKISINEQAQLMLVFQIADQDVSVSPQSLVDGSLIVKERVQKRSLGGQILGFEERAIA